MMETSGTVRSNIFKRESIPLDVLSSKLKTLHENKPNKMVYMMMILFFSISVMTKAVIPFMQV